MTSEIPKEHPRYQSLLTRLKIEDGVKQGITNLGGLIAHGRGEAFDYLIGEKTHGFALEAIKAAACLIALAKKPVISVNGNTAVLVTDEFIELSRETGAALEINLFYDAPERREKIRDLFAKSGTDIFGVQPDAQIPGLMSNRAKVDSRGILHADVVLVSLEDGDRTEYLLRGGKKVIAIDLNPLSRTPQAATISIVDNVIRAIPILTRCYREMRAAGKEACNEVLLNYSNAQILRDAENEIRIGRCGEEKAT